MTRRVTLVVMLVVAAFAPSTAAARAATVTPGAAPATGATGATGALVPAGGARITAETPIAAQSPGVAALRLTISTPALAAPTLVNVYLPAGYATEPQRRWPVTYYLHGAGGDNTHFSQLYGDLIGGYPSIVVTPSGGALGFYADWYNTGAGGPPDYQTYDIDQLIPLIDANFRTIAARRGRALIGESMGGYGVMAYAALYPDMFAAAASMSGAVDVSYLPAIPVVDASAVSNLKPPDAIFGPWATQEVRWLGHNPTDLAGNLDGIDLRVTTANGQLSPADLAATGPSALPFCPVEGLIHTMNLNFQAQLVADDIPHQYEDYGAGCHTTWNFRRQFTADLPFLEAAFAHPPAVPPVVNYATIQPTFSDWGWQVAADPKRALEFMRLTDASRDGLTLTGSGMTTVTTPAFFAHARAVQVRVGTDRQIVKPSSGRLSFVVDLGAPHPYQEYTSAAESAGELSPSYFTTRTVAFTVVRGRLARHRRKA